MPTPSDPPPTPAPSAASMDDRPGSAGAWRMLDASANRAAEALRVIEDVVRFVLDDAWLTGLAKSLRHDLAALLAGADLPGRVAARDVSGDVGPSLRGVETLPRAATGDLVAANAARAAQALRSLQECALLLRPSLAERFEGLRYRLYDLERAAAGMARARERLAAVTLCVLVDGRTDRHAFGTLVEGLLGAGVGMIQLRDKALPVPLLADRAALAVSLARRAAAPAAAMIVVNDRPDVAVAVGAAGVHLGEDDLPVPLARRVVGPGLLVGRTAHGLDEARAALRDGADCLGVGPCFPSSTKSFGTEAPRSFLAAVGGSFGLPVFAIGGVTLDRLDELARLGLRRVAVAAAITAADDPPSMAARFIGRLARMAPPAPAAADTP